MLHLKLEFQVDIIKQIPQGLFASLWARKVVVIARLGIILGLSLNQNHRKVLRQVLLKE